LDNRRTEPQGITRGIYRNYIAQDLHKKGWATAFYPSWCTRLTLS